MVAALIAERGSLDGTNGARRASAWPEAKILRERLLILPDRLGSSRTAQAIEPAPRYTCRSSIPELAEALWLSAQKPDLRQSARLRSKDHEVLEKD
jgi:hypothetical protein